MLGNLDDDVPRRRSVPYLRWRYVVGLHQSPSRLGYIADLEVRTRGVDQMRGTMFERQPSPSVSHDGSLVLGNRTGPLVQFDCGGHSGQVDGRRSKGRLMVVLPVAHPGSHLRRLVQQVTGGAVVARSGRCQGSLHE